MATSDKEFAQQVNSGVAGGINDGSLGYSAGAQTRASSAGGTGGGGSSGSGSSLIETIEQLWGAVAAGLFIFGLVQIEISLPWYLWVTLFFVTAFLATKYFNRSPRVVSVIGYVAASAASVAAFVLIIFAGREVFNIGYFVSGAIAVAIIGFYWWLFR